MTDKPADPSTPRGQGSLPVPQRTQAKQEKLAITDKKQQAQSSLPLFDDPLVAVIPASTPGAGPAKAPSRNGNQEAQAVNGHLLAARRLAQRMRRLRNQREEQTRTGQAICHHLKAMLTEIRPSS